MNFPIRIFQPSKVTASRHAALLQLAKEVPGINKVTVVRGNPVLFMLEFVGSNDALVLKRQQVEVAVASMRLAGALAAGAPVDLQRFAGHDFE